MTFELGLLGGHGAQTTQIGERKKLADTGRRGDNSFISVFQQFWAHTHKAPKNAGRDGGGICEKQKNACSS